MRADELIERIETVSSTAPALPEIVPQVRDLLDGDHGLAYRVSPGEAGWACDFAIGAGFDERFREPMTRFFASVPGRYAWFDPLHPEPAQQNRAVQVSKLVPKAEFEKAPVTRNLLVPLGLAKMDQLRALICDGGTLLSWVGAFRRKPFGEREQKLLQSLVRPLRNRLRLEQQLQRSALLERGLLAALELIPSPAYLLSKAGKVELANRAAQALPGAPDPNGALRVAIRGFPAYSLVIRTPPRADLIARLASARLRWRLSSREVEVLHCLALGDANKTIAEKLRRAEVTVERHVTALLRKSGADSRTALLAQLWTAA